MHKATKTKEIVLPERDHHGCTYLTETRIEQRRLERIPFTGWGKEYTFRYVSRKALLKAVKSKANNFVRCYYRSGSTSKYTYYSVLLTLTQPKSISIGCNVFTGKDATAIYKWLGVKPPKAKKKQ